MTHVLKWQTGHIDSCKCLDVSWISHQTLLPPNIPLSKYSNEYWLEATLLKSLKACNDSWDCQIIVYVHIALFFMKMLNALVEVISHESFSLHFSIGCFLDQRMEKLWNHLSYPNCFLYNTLQTSQNLWKNSALHVPLIIHHFALFFLAWN